MGRGRYIVKHCQLKRHINETEKEQLLKTIKR